MLWFSVSEYLIDRALVALMEGPMARLSAVPIRLIVDQRRTLEGQQTSTRRRKIPKEKGGGWLQILEISLIFLRDSGLLTRCLMLIVQAK